MNDSSRLSYETIMRVDQPHYRTCLICVMWEINNQTRNHATNKNYTYSKTRHAYFIEYIGAVIPAEVVQSQKLLRSITNETYNKCRHVGIYIYIYEYTTWFSKENFGFVIGTCKALLSYLYTQIRIGKNPGFVEKPRPVGFFSNNIEKVIVASFIGIFLKNPVWKIKNFFSMY